MVGFRFVGICVSVLALAGCQTVDLNQYMPRRNAEPMGETVSAPTSGGSGGQASVNRNQVEPGYIPRTDELMGSDAVTLQSFLGEPSLRRAEEGSEVWQYRSTSCVLFVFLYPNEAGQVRVSYLTSSGAHQGQQTPGDQQCVEAVTRAAANELVG